MRYEELFQVEAKADKAAAATAPDEYRFRFDPSARQLTDKWRSLVTGARSALIRTGREWAWTGRIEMGDTTTGKSRKLPLTIHLVGAIPNGEALAKAALERVLPYFRDDASGGRFDTTAMIEEVLRGLVWQHELKVKGGIAQACSADAVAETCRWFRQGFHDKGVHVSEVELYPANWDPAIRGRTDELIDFTDGGKPLVARDPHVLGERPIGYKVRLRYRKDSLALAANYTYQGTIFGTEAGPPLTEPGVAGQIQPLELWFRKVLQAELMAEPLDSRHPVASEALKQRLSDVLARGTGHEIVTLILLSATNAATAQSTSGQISFEAQYSILGLGKTNVRITHEALYRVVDQDKWRAAGAQDVPKLLRGYIETAVTRFLHGQEYGQIVGLFADSIREKRPLDARLQRDVVEEAKAAGIEVTGPIASILDLPGHDFVKGQLIQLDEAAYKMRGVSNVRTCCTIAAHVMLSPALDERRTFATAYQNSGTFAQDVRQRIREVMARELETSIEPAQFYNSILMVRSPERAIELTDMVGQLQAILDAELTTSYGLKVLRLDVNRSAEDQVASRLYEIFNHNRLEVAETVERGPDQLATVFRFTLTIRIRTVTIAGWNGFHSRVARATLGDHLDEVAQAARDALRKAVSALHADPDALRTAVCDGVVAWQIAERIAAECGFAVEVVDLSLQVVPPVTNQRAQRRLARREEEYAQVRGLLAQDPDAHRRRELVRRLDELDDEIGDLQDEIGRQARSQSVHTASLAAAVGLLPDGRPDHSARSLLGRKTDTAPDAAPPGPAVPGD